MVASHTQTSTPLYEAGWMGRTVDGVSAGYTAFLRPFHEGWYDMHHCETWWQAMALAVDIASKTPRCEFVGGPNERIA